MRDDPIATVLDDLLRLDDILACVVARRNMISVMPSSQEFKPEVNQIWDVIKRAMDDVFTVIGEYSGAGLSEMEFRLQDYEVLFYVFPDTENALVAIVPALANKGLLENSLNIGLPSESKTVSAATIKNGELEFPSLLKYEI